MGIPNSPVRKAPPLVATENCLVIGDIHVPYHDENTLELALECGRAADVDNIILSGDFLSMDAVYDGGTAQSVLQEIELGKKIIEELRDGMNKPVRFYWIMGNHEWRLVSMTERQLNISAMARMLDVSADLTVSDLAWMKIRGWGIVSHPGNYSKIPFSVPQELAEIHRTNIITAHGHHVGKTFSKSGYTVIEGGVCCDPDRAMYKQRLQKRMPKWGKGFVITKKPATGKTYAKVFTLDEPCLAIAQAMA